MSEQAAPGLDRQLTVTEAALIDAQQGIQAMARRRAQMGGGDPAVPLTESDKRRDDPWPADVLAELTRPVRIELDFRDPVHLRDQLDILLPVLLEARKATFDHSPGIARQLMRLHSIVKEGAVALVYKNGKAPSGKRRIKTR